MRCGGSDMRCGGSDMRCGGSDMRCGRSDRRCGGSDMRCGRSDMKCGGNEPHLPMGIQYSKPRPQHGCPHITVPVPKALGYHEAQHMQGNCRGQVR